MLRTVASAAAGLGVERLDQAQQTRPRHDLIHLGVLDARAGAKKGSVVTLRCEFYRVLP